MIEFPLEVILYEGNEIRVRCLLDYTSGQSSLEILLPFDQFEGLKAEAWSCHQRERSGSGAENERLLWERTVATVPTCCRWIGEFLGCGCDAKAAVRERVTVEAIDRQMTLTYVV